MLRPKVETSSLDPLITGGGAMGDLLRSVDWSKTPVGAPETWSTSLRSTVRTLLECQLPMYLAWGKDLTQFYNDAYRPILGTKKHPQAMGSSVVDTWPEIWPTIGPMWQEVLSGKPIGFDDFKLTIERNGYPEDCYFNFSYSPVRDDDGSICGVLVTFAETTERVLSEQRIRKYAEEAEAANLAKTRFLANMSHEIRTPLGAMLGFSDLLRDESLAPEDRKRYHEIISRSGQSLTELIGDILDFSKVETGSLETEKLSFNLKELLSDVIALLRLKANEKALCLELVCGPSVPACITSDPVRLRQILLNIIGNAVKFTERGSITVDVQKRVEGDSPILEISVSDSGTGIADEHQARLFQPFTQADSSMTRRFGGTGLGLELSRRLAEALGGTVYLKSSALKVGSVFVITVACDESEGENEAPVRLETASVGRTSLQGLRILLADDSHDNQLLLQRVLQREHAVIDLASNGEEALEKALAGHHDVILMDLQMPVMNGFEATEKLRMSGCKKPIIALTAHATKEDRELCEAAGFDDHLTKPVNVPNLLSCLSRFLPAQRTV